MQTEQPGAAPARVSSGAANFYPSVLLALNRAGVRFLVGGGVAFNEYTGLDRPVKDFDLFLLESECARAMDVLAADGCQTDLKFPHWLGKAWKGDDFVDLIFNSGNGVAGVDEVWFEHAVPGTIFGAEVLLAPVEEMIWSKSFIMERERYDGADVAHMLHSQGEKLDWPRMLARFGPYWRVLLSHLVLFNFIYPFDRTKLPEAVTQFLLRRLRKEMTSPTPEDRVCNGTLLSRGQYLVDVEEWGYRDGRLDSPSRMTPSDIMHWTQAMREEGII